MDETVVPDQHDDAMNHTDDSPVTQNPDYQKPGLTEEQIATLLRPLNKARVATRSQSGQTLSYLEQHDVRAHMTRVFGFCNWSSRVVETRHLFEERVPALRQGEPVVDNKTGEVKTNWYCAWQATVELTIMDQQGQVLTSYSDVAIGGNTQPQRHEANDMSLKTAVSDALKRAATNLGDQFGLSLYQKGSTGPIVRGIVGREATKPTPIEPEKADKLSHSIGMQGDDPADVRRIETVELPPVVPTPFERPPVTTVDQVHDALNDAVAASKRPRETKPGVSP